MEGNTTLVTTIFKTDVVGNVIATKKYSDYTLATAYATAVPADYDVVARDTADTDNFVKYDPNIATHIVVGIIGTYDATNAVIEMIDKADDAVLTKLGIDNMSTATLKQTATDALRGQGIHTI